MSDMAQKDTAFKVLLAIGVAHLLNDAVQSVIPAIYPIIKDEFALTFTQIGLITLVFQMTRPYFNHLSVDMPTVIRALMHSQQVCVYLFVESFYLLSPGTLE